MKLQPSLSWQHKTLIETAEDQLRSMGEITRKTLSFIGDQAKPATST